VWLAAAMLAAFVVSSAVPILREFYEIEVLEPLAYVAIAAAVVGWALLLKAIVGFGLDEWLGHKTEQVLTRRVLRQRAE
jgi:hypothetical protein